MSGNGQDWWKAVAAAIEDIPSDYTSRVRSLLVEAEQDMGDATATHGESAVPVCGSRPPSQTCYREPGHRPPCSWHPAFWRERPSYCGGCGRPMMTDEERLGLVEAGSAKCQYCADLP